MKTNRNPVLPPDHPSDLVVDIPGAYLGKRSERLLVRWKKQVFKTPIRKRLALVVPKDSECTEDGESGLKQSTKLSSEDSTDRAGDLRPADQISQRLLAIWAPVAEELDNPPTISKQERFESEMNRFSEDSVEPTAAESAENQSCERMVPMCKLRSVTISGNGITISSDLIAALLERGIGLSFLSAVGQPIAQLSSPGLNGTVQTRRCQLAAYDTSLGVDLAVEFVCGKLRNQKHQLQYSAKYLKATYPDRYARVEKKILSIQQIRRQVAAIRGDSIHQVRDRVMGFEGTAARLYWEGVAIILEGRVEFTGRITRGATDPINAALNYGYGILYSKVSAAIVNAGLEMYAGFLHVDRPGKPALVLDLVEEFRAPVVDRAVLGIVNQGIGLNCDKDGLTVATRRLVAERVLGRMATAVPYEGKNWPLSSIIQMQARHLAVAVRGERVYKCFSSRW